MTLTAEQIEALQDNQFVHMPPNHTKHLPCKRVFDLGDYRNIAFVKQHVSVCPALTNAGPVE
jgi:hypothetical protein